MTISSRKISSMGQEIGGVSQARAWKGFTELRELCAILNKQYLGTLKDLKLRQSGKEGFIFQQDNDPKHWCKVAEEWFRKKNVWCLLWPPSSPDMNIIEHVWDQLDALVCACYLLPCNKEL